MKREGEIIVKISFGKHLISTYVGILFVLAAFALSGCGMGTISIDPPAPNSYVSSPFPVEIRWDGDVKGLDTIQLDGVDVKPQFIFDYSNNMAAASLVAGTGKHKIDASYQIPPPIFGRYGGSRKDGSVAFNVGTPPGDFNFNVSPSPLVIQRGQSGQAALTVSRSGSFQGDVAVTTSGLPTGVTANPVTIPSTQTTGSLTVSTSDSTPFGQKNISVIGKANINGITTTKNQSVQLKVNRVQGNFVEITGDVVGQT